MSGKDLENVSQHFASLLENISAIKIQLTELQNNIRFVERQTSKQIKRLDKQLNKRIPKQKKKPSGFAKPSIISNELCEFLEKPSGTQIARTEVTQHLISYIKKHNLQNDENKRVIQPDEKLQKLLKVSTEDKVTYFNIQKYMNPHFKTVSI